MIIDIDEVLSNLSVSLQLCWWFINIWPMIKAHLRFLFLKDLALKVMHRLTPWNRWFAFLYNIVVNGIKSFKSPSARSEEGKSDPD